MKKILVRFTESLISSDQMKKIKGSYSGGCGTCDQIVTPSSPYMPPYTCDSISWPDSPEYTEGQCVCSTGAGCHYLA